MLEAITKTEVIAMELNKEQVEAVRFCLGNWEKIKYLRDKGIFKKTVVLANVQANYKPTGEVQNVHYHFVDNTQEDIALIKTL